MIKSALITICRSEGELKLQPKQYTCAHSFTEDINSLRDRKDNESLQYLFYSGEQKERKI